MLRLVGHPVAVNPDTELAQIAEREGWEVLRFEQLGRRLKAVAALVAMGLVGTAGPSGRDAARGRRPAGVAAKPGWVARGPAPRISAAAEVRPGSRCTGRDSSSDCR